MTDRERHLLVSLLQDWRELRPGRCVRAWWRWSTVFVPDAGRVIVVITDRASRSF